MKRIILLILCFLPAALLAQSAMDYFHTAANHYVNADKKKAKTTIQEGIRKFPDSQKLKTLASKIEQLPDPEEDKNKQNQNQQNQDKEQQQGQGKSQEDKNKQENKQQQAEAQQRKEDAKRQLDALQQNEKRTQEKAKEAENQQTKSGKQEKDW